MRVEEMFAFVVEETPGDEGVPAFSVAGMMVPLMGADWARVESLRPRARELARMLGKPVTLLKFSVREEIETIEPG